MSSEWEEKTQELKDKLIQKLITRTTINEIFDGYTALQLAVKRGYADVVRGLIEAKADLDMSLEVTESSTALHIATGLNEYEIMNILLDAGASINVRDANNLTPFMVFLKYYGQSNAYVRDYE